MSIEYRFYAVTFENIDGDYYRLIRWNREKDCFVEIESNMEFIKLMDNMSWMIEALFDNADNKCDGRIEKSKLALFKVNL